MGRESSDLDYLGIREKRRSGSWFKKDLEVKPLGSFFANPELEKLFTTIGPEARNQWIELTIEKVINLLGDEFVMRPKSAEDETVGVGLDPRKLAILFARRLDKIIATYERVNDRELLERLKKLLSKVEEYYRN